MLLENTKFVCFLRFSFFLGSSGFVFIGPVEPNPYNLTKELNNRLSFLAKITITSTLEEKTKTF